jgi:hypothetical protein
MTKKRKKLTGTESKLAILRSKYLPDYPEPFRKQMVVGALEAAGYDVEYKTLDAILLSMLSLGYLVRSEGPVTAETFQPYHLWMFAHPNRTSDRPGWRPGEQYDLWKLLEG